MIAISRLKATNLGLDPPRFPYDEHLTAEQHEEWIPREIDVKQLWDAELSAPDVDNRGNDVTQGNNVENRSGNVDRQEGTEGNDEAEREKWGCPQRYAPRVQGRGKPNRVLKKLLESCVPK